MKKNVSNEEKNVISVVLGPLGARCEPAPAGRGPVQVDKIFKGKEIL